ncbi:MAG: anti-sigma factor family protein [Rudaea sp.]
MNSQDLTCQELVELVTDYLEGALSHEERARFERHLGVCDGCSRYVEEMRLTIATVGRLTEESLAPDAKRELLDVFRNWNKRRS